MKNYSLLIILLFPLFCSAQKEKSKEVVINNKEIQSFVQRTGIIKSIRFSKSGINQVWLKPDTFLRPEYAFLFESGYNLNFSHHKYFFQKQFGDFPVNTLISLLDTIKIDSCFSYYYSGKITETQIFIEVISDCPDETGEKVFTKVETHAEFPGGQPAFQEYLQKRLSKEINKETIQADSAFLFKMIIGQTGQIEDAWPADSSMSKLRTIISQVLKECPAWKPFYKDSRPARAYRKVFILIRKDGIIEAGYN